MIEDINRLETATLDADLCIVGAGAAGISLALQISVDRQADHSVEAGGRLRRRRDAIALRGEVADERLHAPADRYRQRRFGGSTTIWGRR